MNHAFIFQVHNYPELLNRIINLLIAPNHYCFIHVDKKVNIIPFKQMINNEHVVFLNDNERIIVNHGGFSQIQCTINLLKKVNDFHIKFDYIHSLSGQDFPLVSPIYFDNFFEKNNGYSYMMFDSEEEHLLWTKPNGKYEERYRKFYFIDSKPNPIFIKLINGIQHFLYLRKPIKQIRAGWSWFSWHISIANFVLQYLTENPQYLQRFKHTSCCDEIIFQTLLYPYIKELNIIPNNCLRYIDWHPKREYTGKLPLILNEKDFTSIANSHSLFCRKIEPKESQQLLCKIEQVLIHIPSNN